MPFKSAVVGLAFVSLVSVAGLAAAEPLDGAYRGMIVCEKLQTSQFMLRAPFDITINGKTAVAARPIFNLKGTRAWTMPEGQQTRACTAASSSNLSGGANSTKNCTQV